MDYAHNGDYGLAPLMRHFFGIQFYVKPFNFSHHLAISGPLVPPLTLLNNLCFWKQDLSLRDCKILLYSFWCHFDEWSFSINFSAGHFTLYGILRVSIMLICYSLEHMFNKIIWDSSWSFMTPFWWIWCGTLVRVHFPKQIRETEDKNIKRCLHETHCLFWSFSSDLLAVRKLQDNISLILSNTALKNIQAWLEWLQRINPQTNAFTPSTLHLGG